MSWNGKRRVKIDRCNMRFISKIEFYWFSFSFVFVNFTYPQTTKTKMAKNFTTLFLLFLLGSAIYAPKVYVTKRRGN